MYHLCLVARTLTFGKVVGFGTHWWCGALADAGLILLEPHSAPHTGSLARLVRAVCDRELAPKKLTLTSALIQCNSIPSRAQLHIDRNHRP